LFIYSNKNEQFNDKKKATTTLFELINKFNVNFQSLSSFQKIFWTFNCEKVQIMLLLLLKNECDAIALGSNQVEVEVQ
jgi:hypothetical protein